MKILNLYAGIGGNRKLWENVDVTAIEINPKIAKIYQDFYPDDKVIVEDAHKYLQYHYQEFDFIWSSPPCPTHSKMVRLHNSQGYKIKYPDMKLYEEIIFLKHWFKGKWVVENVNGYYKPLVRPHIIQRHYFWSNFFISKGELNQFPADHIKEQEIDFLEKHHDIDLSKYIKKIDRAKVLANCVYPPLALHVFKCAFKDIQIKLEGGKEDENN
jgi:DNA (cytosine-5)-methyltransferase 1